MKITVVLGAFFPVPPVMGGAVEKAWWDLGQQFASRDHQVTFISRRMPGLPRQEIANGIQHLRVSGFNSPRSLVWLKFLDLLYSLNAKASLPNADIIVTNTFWLPILLGNPKRGQIYVHVGRYPKGQMRLYNRAARLQAPSTAIAEAIRREAPQFKGRVSVIPYPVPKPLDTSLPPLNARPKNILFVGRVHPEKGVHLLIEAFVKRMRTVFAEWRLMIVGPTETNLGGGGADYRDKLKAAAVAAGDRIVFTGAVFDRHALDQLFADTRIFVYPSLARHGESFGLAPLEAMAHGCAVLVSKLDCFTDFIRDGETGFIFNHDALEPSEALSEQLAKMVSEPDRVASLADKGFRVACEYSVEQVGDRFLADFDSILQHAERANR